MLAKKSSHLQLGSPDQQMGYFCIPAYPERALTNPLCPVLSATASYVRGDSIIPMGPEMSYVGEKPFNPITLDIWLCSEAECTLYDDDEIVRCRARKTEGKIILDLDASQKTYIVKFNKTGCPTKVVLNGVDVQRLRSYEELERAECGWYFDPSFTVYVKFDALGSRSRLVLQA